MNNGNDMLAAIAAVMVVSGALGGLVGRFLDEAGGAGRVTAEADAPMPPALAWWKHVLIGITAALMVPIFLDMISSDLIDRIRGQAGQERDPAGLLNLAGFCLVAAVSSRSFIGSLSARLLQEVRQARHQAAEAASTATEARSQASDAAAAADSAMQQATAGQMLAQAQWLEEADTTPSSRRSRDSRPAADAALTEPDRLLLHLLAQPPATLRLPATLAQQAGLDPQAADTALLRLQSRGWAGLTLGSDGQPRCFVTASGRAALTRAADADAGT